MRAPDRAGTESMLGGCGSIVAAGAAVTAQLSVPSQIAAPRRGRPLATQSIRVIVYFIQLILDLGSILLGFGISSMIRHGSNAPSIDTTALLTLIPLFLVIGFYAGAYSYQSVSARQGIQRVLTSLAVAIAFN